jgi:large subunit ribosomal protein L25
MERFHIKKRSLDNGSHKMAAAKIVPGVIYGPTIKTIPVKANYKELSRITNKSGEIFEVMDKEELIFVKFGEVQKDPISNKFIHFELIQLPTDMKSKVEVPIGLKGRPLGEKNGGTLVIYKDELTLNAKANTIPEQITADVTQLDIGDKLTVYDLNSPSLMDSLENEISSLKVPLTHGQGGTPLLGQFNKTINFTLHSPATKSHFFYEAVCDNEYKEANQERLAKKRRIK